MLNCEIRTQTSIKDNRCIIKDYCQHLGFSFIPVKWFKYLVSQSQSDRFPCSCRDIFFTLLYCCFYDLSKALNPYYTQEGQNLSFSWTERSRRQIMDYVSPVLILEGRLLETLKTSFLTCLRLCLMCKRLSSFCHFVCSFIALSPSLSLSLFFSCVAQPLSCFIIIPLVILLLNGGTFPCVRGKSNLYAAPLSLFIVLPHVPFSPLFSKLRSDTWCQVSVPLPSLPTHNGHLQKDLAIWARPSGWHCVTGRGGGGEPSLMARAKLLLSCWSISKLWCMFH